MTTAIPIEEPQPSQLYLDASRFRNAVSWFDFDDPTYDPIPTLSIRDETVLSDGHTRAFLAYLSGAEEIVTVRDPDRDEMNIPLYSECVKWCKDESVTEIRDLAGRVVSQETFLDKWVARCHQSPLYGSE